MGTRSNSTSNQPVSLLLRDQSGASVGSSQSYSRFPAEVRDNPDLSFGARLTYSMLVGFAIDSNRVYPGQALLASRLGVSDRSVRTYLDELRLAGLLSVDRRGLTKTNVYILSVWVGSDQAPDRKHTSGQERKHTSGHDRKHASDNNEENYYDENHDEEINTARKRAPSTRSHSELTKIRASELRRQAQSAKIDALCSSAGIDRAHVSQRHVDEWSITFSQSDMTVEDIRSLTAYFLTQPWYRDHRERVTAKALVKAWPGWVASGRPTSERVPTSRHTAGDETKAKSRDGEMRDLAQRIADERGEVFNGVAPSYWSVQEGGGV